MTTNLRVGRSNRSGAPTITTFRAAFLERPFCCYRIFTTSLGISAPFGLGGSALENLRHVAFVAR